MADASEETGVPQGTHVYWQRSYPEYAAEVQEVLASTEGLRKASIAARIGEGSTQSVGGPGAPGSLE